MENGVATRNPHDCVSLPHRDAAPQFLYTNPLKYLMINLSAKLSIVIEWVLEGQFATQRLHTPILQLVSYNNEKVVLDVTSTSTVQGTVRGWFSFLHYFTRNKPHGN